MYKISLSKKTMQYSSALGSYTLELEVTNAEGLSKAVFIKQRLYKADNSGYEDVFAAIAKPSDLAEFDEQAPAKGTSYFRDSKVQLIARTAEYLDEVYKSITVYLKQLVDDLNTLDNYKAEMLVEISSD